MNLLRRLLRELERLVVIAYESRAAWAVAIRLCLEETVDALALNTAEGIAVGLVCFGKLILIARELSAPAPVQALIAQIHSQLQRLQLQQGGSPMACVTTHNVTQKVQGPGVCCAALSASGLTPAVGVRVAATNAKGQCIVCEVKASVSKAHPGALVFKRGKSHVAGSSVSCPTTSEGCCALTGA